jgi:SPP1 gp7 family putative phage head morphogenesis protein
MARSAAAEFAYLHRQTPEGALAYLRRRGKLSATFNWQDLWRDEHARQFTVSRLTRLDLLKALQDSITRSVDGDLTRRDWMRDAKKLLEKEKWWGKKTVIDPETGKEVKTTFNSRRLELIYDTNTRQAYAAGQWGEIERAKETHPYIRYVTRRDDKVRPAHAAWDNLTLPVDDPFWDTHTPPCDYRCRCRITTMSASEYEKRAESGRIVTKRPDVREIPFFNKRTGEITQAPVGVNPAFAYNPGKPALRDANFANFIGTKLSDAPAELGAAFMADAGTTVETALDNGFTAFVDDVRRVGKTRHKTAAVGAMTSKEMAAYARETGAMPENAALLFEDRLIVGRKAARHALKGDALTDAELKAVPALLRGEGREVYLQKENGNLIYLLPTEDKAVKLAVEVDFVQKKPKGKVNMIRATFKIDPSRIRNAPKEFQRLK